MPEPNLPATAEIQILTADEVIPQLPRQVEGHAETFSEAELEEMVKTYNHDYLRAPLTKDHAQEGPALGWVKKLTKRGKALFAEVYGLAAELVKDVREGRYGSISIEADLNFKNTGKPYLTAVSFLGAGNPACAGMQRPILSDRGELLAFSSASGENILCTSSRKLTLEEMGMMEQAQFDFDNFDLGEAVQDEKEMDYLSRILWKYRDAVERVQYSDRTDKADLIRKYTAQLQKAVSKKEGAELSDKNKGGTAMSGENKELEVKLTAAETKLTATEAELAKLREEKKAQEARLADMENKLKLQEIGQALDKLVAEGKVTPAERKNGNLDAMLANLPDDTKVKLGDKEVTLRESILAGYAARVPVVNLSSRPVSMSDGKTPSSVLLPHGVKLDDTEPASVDFEEKVREVQLRDKCDRVTAMKRANAENPGLYEKTVKTKPR